MHRVCAYCTSAMVRVGQDMRMHIPSIYVHKLESVEPTCVKNSLCPFRDGEDLDELLERQADMIRYLQQHNANLGRRILELQAGAME